MRSINLIVIHCSASPNGRPVTTADIDSWHYAEPNNFRRQLAWRQRQEMNLSAIGYHWVIYTNGAVANGRHLDEIGAHAGKPHNYNPHSIGVCLIGTDQFSARQWESLRDNVCTTIAVLAARTGRTDAPRRMPSPADALALADRMGLRILGHRDLPEVKKVCPGFDVAAWLTGGMQPLAGHLLEDAG